MVSRDRNRDNWKEGTYQPSYVNFIWTYIFQSSYNYFCKDRALLVDVVSNQPTGKVNWEWGECKPMSISVDFYFQKTTCTL